MLLFVGDAMTAAVEVGEGPEAAANSEEDVVDVFTADVMLEVTLDGVDGLAAAASTATACW